MVKYDDNVGMLIRVINENLQRKANSYMKIDDVTLPQLGILLFLSNVNKNIATLKEIEKEFNISQPAVAGFAKRMEKKGLVTEIVDEKDKRVKKVKLTKKGLETKKKADKNVKVFEEEMLNCFTESEKKKLVILLQKMANNLIG